MYTFVYNPLRLYHFPIFFKWSSGSLHPTSTYMLVWCGAVGWCIALHAEVEGSIAVGVVGTFYLLNHSGRTMALGSTHPLTQMSIRNISCGGRGVKGGRCVGLTTLPPSCADCLENWDPQTPGTLNASRGIFTINIPILACSILFEVQIDSFHIRNEDELVLRKIHCITDCPIKSNKTVCEILCLMLSMSSFL